MNGLDQLFVFGECDTSFGRKAEANQREQPERVRGRSDQVAKHTTFVFRSNLPIFLVTLKKQINLKLKEERESGPVASAFARHHAHVRAVSRRAQELDSQLVALHHQRFSCLLSRSLPLVPLLLLQQ